MQPGDPGEQVREVPLGITQEGPFAPHAPQLSEEREGMDFGVRVGLGLTRLHGSPDLSVKSGL
jgi:hypothetical protein